MKRYRILLAAVVMQMCLGAMYAWSVFVLPIKEIAGIFQGTAQLPFSLFYFAFPATMVVTGTLLPSLGPRRCAMIGGLLFGGGWMLAALGRHHFAWCVLGIGLLAGVGVGFAYIVPIATCVRWFPRQKGLVTGVAVAGFGGGAALVSHVAGALMADPPAFGPFTVFGLLGASFLLLVTLAGATMENPPDLPAAAGRRMPIREVLGEPAFVCLYLAMVTGLAAGFAVNANLKELVGGVSVHAGVRAVACFAMANAAGRIIWGGIFDRCRSTVVLQANLLLQAALLSLHTLILRSEIGLAGFAVFAGFNYGGILVLYASAAAERWGSERLSQIYGWLFSANILAAVSPIVAGAVFDRWGNFSAALWGIAALLIGGAAALSRGSGEVVEINSK